MDKRLPSDFTFSQYGLDVRLINETDSEFIVALRTDSVLGRFINPTDTSVKEQINWVRKYKERESAGTDYYFIYSSNGEPMGVNRIYDITTIEFTGGSFVFKKNSPFEIPVLATLIQLDIAFNMLGKEIMHGDVRLDNHKVLKFHKLLHIEFINRSDIDQYILYRKETFNQRKPIIESMLIE
ncbi:MAG: hypothetical protein RR346_08700 [Bacteroidales bacterium]